MNERYNKVLFQAVESASQPHPTRTVLPISLASDELNRESCRMNEIPVAAAVGNCYY